jgi:5-methylcytosine-specific restriction endonuclease McrA
MSSKMLKKVKRVLELHGWRCQKCGSLEDLQVHHKIRRSQQGDDALANLVTLCAYCRMAEHRQLSYDISAVKALKKTPERGRQHSNSSASF